MNRPTRLASRFALVLLALAPVSTTPAPDERPAAARVPAVPAQDQPAKRCCFTNPGYTGACEVQPAKDESCGQILDYLNNGMSQGKSYCNNTTIRGGWKQAACGKK